MLTPKPEDSVCTTVIRQSPNAWLYSRLSLIPFLPYLLLSVSPYPCLVPPVTPFLHQPCIHLVLTIPSRTLTHPVITTYDHTQTIPSRSPSLLLPSISSLCNLYIPQSEYHL